MREAFVKTLVEIASQDPRILLLTGDLGFMALEPFSERFPDRFFNMGVAEQNMIGVATGLAEAGEIPFAYSIVPFAVLRPYEFIRNGPVFHRLPVRIVGVGGGLDYGYNGPSHHGFEDIGLMRMQPGLTIIVPADHEQTRSAFLATWDLPGPVYYRISKGDKKIVPGLGGRFKLGKAEFLREGKDLLMIAMGGISCEVALAAQSLAAQGISCTVMVISSINPSPSQDLKKVLSQFPLAITVEDHYVVGGLGSLVSEMVAEEGLHCRIVRCGIKEAPDGISGSQRYLYERHRISAKALADISLKTWREIKS